ncbi:hypothetical protein Nepgr_002142 [Nepenthes gracilis]|uniref:1-phosphatidylinositol-3-phosphate 5-kinase n=1 Tax=Nepenthes gracilis TaxID=150966 RepID=A0AAD3RY40_NEPGR|nr:hypothetical protein Nepgr_002142 [Nepenthes gracilis]
MKPGDEDPVEVNHREPSFPCEPCQVNPEPGSTGQDGSSSCKAPLTNRMALLTSTDSFASSCSDSSVEVNTDGRCVDYQDEDQDNLKFKSNGHVKRSSSLNGFDGCGKFNSHKEDRSILTDVEITGTINGREVQGDHGEISDESLDEENGTACPFSDESIADIWMPPEPENKEDDREDSVATIDDDDDEFGDGMKWGSPSSLNSFEEGVNRSSLFKEEKAKAMEEVMNGKLRSLVNQMLKSVGIANVERDGDSWVDIVTSLAWQAASFLKPDGVEGKRMDPGRYVKVKCIEAGSRSQSELIRGLVFKKHAAHKHMPTKYKNPKLLLIRGMLGQSTGLSSFDSMIPQDKDNLKKENLTDNLKPLIENLGACRPNVVLVEKSVSRDVLEAIHEMGITLVFDTKLHRLERVSRCTGSPILSAENMLSQKLKQCDLCYFENFVEEHAHVSKGEKKPRKTLMFLVGCPTHSDCTILLKGSSSSELKRIKFVVRCAVVMAYHFILETSFLLDQKAMFSTITLNGVANLLPTNQQTLRVGSYNSSVCHKETTTAAASGFTDDLTVSNGFHEGSAYVEKSDVLSADQQSTCVDHVNSSVCYNQEVAAAASTYAIDVPISHGFHEGPVHVEESTSKSAQGLDIPISNGLQEGSPSMTLALERKPTICYEPMPAISSRMLSISESLKKVIGENLPLVSPAAYQSICTYIDLNEPESKAHTSAADDVLAVDIPVRWDTDAKGCSNEEKFLNNDSQPLAVSSDGREDSRNIRDREDCAASKDDISTVLDSESILVLMSSRNASSGTICEQSHFSHIKFYRNFDIPLGKFLRDNLLNQSLQCKTCGELPEAHFYYYAHHNRQLTIRVKHLPNDICLPGGSEGKLWMWSRCGKGNGKSTKRVLISCAAQGLSFGKFLELSFSTGSLFNRLSICGHSLRRDFLHFFGLGPMVAMFRYSSVATFTVSVPPQKLDYNNSINGEWLKKETENVYTKGLLLFNEVANYLKKIKCRFSGVNLIQSGSPKEFSDIEETLGKERYNFEENIKSRCIDNGHSVRNLLSLNRIRLELLLEACIWNQRLQLLLSYSARSGLTTPCDLVEQGMDLIYGADREVEATPANAAVEVTQPTADNAYSAGTEGTTIILNDSSKVSKNCTDMELQVEKIPESDGILMKAIPHEVGVQGHGEQDLLTLSSVDGNIQRQTSGNSVPSVSSLQAFVNPLNLLTDPQANDKNGCAESIAVSGHLLADRIIPIMADQRDSSFADNNASEKAASLPVSYLENSKGWVWNPFPEIWQELLNFENLLKFKQSQPPGFLPVVSQVMVEEGSRLHIPFSNGDYIASDYESEISSIIACALALMGDLPPPVENLDESTRREIYSANRMAEGPVGLPRSVSSPSPQWSSGISYDSDQIHPTPSMSMESRLSRFDGLNLLDSLVAFSALHPEVPLGLEEYPGKGKYSVVCMYAREFRGLRNQCCPSEIDYIASLSRCRIWDAKGGKSKSFFAKTLDNRLIVKEIKKTEFESVMKFATYYFHHMNQSFELGNQTCLAKILGIYQVTIRQTKSGKEIKHDLLVMENLSFGRNITRQYDLKGALHARFTPEADATGDVLLDQNFVNDMNASPVYVGQKAKRLLQRAVWNDTTFLNTINVMDYSLLVGVDRQHYELVCGIIDYLRQYTWDKQLETWVKSSLVVPKNVLPTIISPREYKKRFRKFMDTHFLTVPDHWCSQRSSNPCKLCGISGDDSPRAKPKKHDEQNGLPV